MRTMVPQGRGVVASLIFASLLLQGCGYRARLSKSYIPEVADTAAYAGVRARYHQLAALMEKDTGLEPTQGNTLALLPDNSVKWMVMNDDLARARESVYLELYRFSADSIGTVMAAILKGKAREGVDVRVIVDKSATPLADRDSLCHIFGSDVRLDLFSSPFLPDVDGPEMAVNRDHRKILLVDGHTGYLGGRNLTDNYYCHWRDADMRITGPAAEHMTTVYKKSQDMVSPQSRGLNVAANLREQARCDTVPYLEQYRNATVQIVYDCPTDTLLPIRNCFEWVIGHARDYFWFYNPYTPPPPSTLKALEDAAARGVDVRWIVPANNDVPLEKWMDESIYVELLKAGVRIYEWQGNMNHTKQYICDDYLMIIGSANMDNLSFFLNYEVLAIVYDERVARAAARTYRNDIGTCCREITLGEVGRWTHRHRLRNWLTRLLAGNMG